MKFRIVTELRGNVSTGCTDMMGWLWQLGLSKTQKQILASMHMGWTLKSHRYLNGTKVCRLHALNGESADVGDSEVAGLLRRGLIHSNQKFPAATFLLSERGQRITRRFASSHYVLPLTSRCFD